MATKELMSSHKAAQSLHEMQRHDTAGAVLVPGPTRQFVVLLPGPMQAGRVAPTKQHPIPCDSEYSLSGESTGTRNLPGIRVNVKIVF